MLRYGALLVLFTAGCVGGFGQAGDGPLDLPESTIDEDRLHCPIDPDCHIGGDCSLYECPDHWECETFQEPGYEDAERCISPGPDFPADGEWDCYDEDGRTICVGRDYPDDGGGGAWSCERTGDLVVCTNDDPDYPDDGGGGAWSCYYEGDLRICERDRPGDGGGDDCYGPGCEPPGWDCPPDDPTCGRPICTDEERGTVSFDRSDELVVLGDREPFEDCANLRVDVTGYYTLFDDALAESCSTQRDEISYVTISNSCNADGMPLEHNVGDRFIIGDVDNTADCSSDADCGAGTSCQQRSAGYCCVPTTPALVGTFLLVAGEDNQVCLHHFCPEHLAGQGGASFVSAGCTGSINSVHLQLDGDAFVCPDPSLEFPMGCGM